jgi:hypothetical protein
MSDEDQQDYDEPHSGRSWRSRRDREELEWAYGDRRGDDGEIRERHPGYGAGVGEGVGSTVRGDQDDRSAPDITRTSTRDELGRTADQWLRECDPTRTPDGALAAVEKALTAEQLANLRVRTRGKLSAERKRVREEALEALAPVWARYVHAHIAAALGADERQVRAWMEEIPAASFTDYIDPIALAVRDGARRQMP